MDGSHHLWFEDRAQGCCLMNMVDDATGVTLALFDPQESIFSAKTAYKEASNGKYQPASDHPWRSTWSRRQRMKNQAEAQERAFLKS